MNVFNPIYCLFHFSFGFPARLLGRPPCAPYGHPTPNMRHSVEPRSPAPGSPQLSTLHARASSRGGHWAADRPRGGNTRRVRVVTPPPHG